MCLARKRAHTKATGALAWLLTNRKRLLNIAACQEVIWTIRLLLLEFESLFRRAAYVYDVMDMSLGMRIDLQKEFQEYLLN